MTDTGKTILVERKYSIYSQFLDTILQSEGVIQEGETRQQALLRVHGELEETAAELRKRIGVVSAVSQWQSQDHKQDVTTTYASTQPIIIDKSIERLEIAIDNCMCVDELDQLKAANPLFPARLLESFNKKRKELTP